MPRNRFIFPACAAIVLAALIAYRGSLSAPFIFDAAPIATSYPTIRHLWPVWAALSPPHDGSTVDGRPMANFALAVSYAMSGTEVWAYHAVDLAIHILAALTLFGILRRTMERVGPGGPPVRSLLIAFAAALLWTVHPLQTESITYVIQCAESLMGLFYLLTLYCFIRHGEASADRGAGSVLWAVLSIFACLLGMATKEVMVTAPLMVLLYDRTFLAGGFREAWRRRWRYYLALAATWTLLAFLVAGSGNRGGSAGLGVNIRWSDYALTQIYAVCHYLQLAVWPRPQVFDYGTGFVTATSLIIPSALVLLALISGAVWALWRRPAAGYLGAWFFAILAPTSLVPVATQPIAEHRLYLPLAAVMVLAAAALFKGCAALLRGSKAGLAAGLSACLVLAAAYGDMTIRRNALYASETAIWADTVAKEPGNARAHLHLGRALYGANRIVEADRQFRLGLVLQPRGNYDALFDLGNALLREGRASEAAACLEEAVRIRPDSFEAQSSWGDSLFACGRLAEAGDRYEEALRLNPAYALAEYDLGNVLARLGRMAEAVGHYEAALRLNPAYSEAEDNLGNAFLQEGRLDEAIGHYRAAVRLAPDSARAHSNLGGALLRSGRIAEAREHYEAALRLEPDLAEVREILSRLPSADPQ